MNIAGLVLFVILVSAFVAIPKFQLGGLGLPMDKPGLVPSADSIYLQQYRELDNVDNVLLRPLTTGDNFINNLMPTLDDKGQQSLPKLMSPFVTEVSKQTKSIIESKQPYFLDDVKIVNYYGVPHYWDWRYPRQPIPIEFAVNPEKYTKEHPGLYPSYIISSRDYSNLKDNEI
jgi:hypothetical protein